MIRQGVVQRMNAKADLAAEDLRTLVNMFETRQPGSPLMHMCARALDLYDAAEGTGDANLVDQVGQFMAQLTRGILMGLSTEVYAGGTTRRLHG